MKDLHIREIINQFQIYGDLLSFQSFGSGHINSTYMSTFNQAGTMARYTHQRINRKVFYQPVDVMENIVLVTEHIKNNLINTGISNPSNRVLTVIPARDGKTYYCDMHGDFWRTYLFIENTQTFDVLDDPGLAHKVGAAVAYFQSQLSDYAGPRLKETIPRFHDMQLRYEQLDAALSADIDKRALKASDEIAFLQKNRKRGMLLIDGLKNNSLREGITHNDAKLNNILFSVSDNTALCVIDLDTVMPGTILFDTGDLIRTSTITGMEDEHDVSKISFSFELFSALIQGYLSVADSFLTDYEKYLLAESGRNITQIMAVRFLTDYLKGDVYYRTARDAHNLDRARTQIALIQSMDAQWDRVTEFIANL
ncbi:phosphotransferase [Treponema sp.]